MNCRGLNDPGKRQLIWHYLRTECTHVDFFLLTETHCSSSADAAVWEKEWGGFAAAKKADRTSRRAWFATSSSPHTGGTAILLNRKVASDDILHFHTATAHNGAFVSIWYKTKIGIWRIDSVYLPAQAAERGQAITYFFTAPPLYPFDFHLAAGDWNCVESIAHDTEGVAAGYPNHHGTFFCDHTAAHGWADCWTISHTDHEIRGFTRFGASGSKTRLDRVYVSLAAGGLVSDSSVHPTPAFTDHYAVSTTISFDAQKKHPAPYWRLNASLLKDRRCDELVHTMWDWYCTQRDGPVPLIQWWLTWKAMIREALKSYSQMRAKKKRLRLDEVTEELLRAEDLPHSSRNQLQ